MLATAATTEKIFTHDGLIVPAQRSIFVPFREENLILIHNIYKPVTASKEIIDWCGVGACLAALASGGLVLK